MTLAEALQLISLTKMIRRPFWNPLCALSLVPDGLSTLEENRWGSTPLSEDFPVWTGPYRIGYWRLNNNAGLPRGEFDGYEFNEEELAAKDWEIYDPNKDLWTEYESGEREAWSWNGDDWVRIEPPDAHS